MPKNIVQMNNKYIKDESQRKRFLEEERKKRNRFMGLVLILVMLLFILPTYNLAQSYQSLQDKKEQYKQLEKEYKETSEQKEYQQDIAKKLNLCSNLDLPAIDRSGNTLYSELSLK